MTQQLITKEALEIFELELSQEETDELLEVLNDALGERVSERVTEVLTPVQLKTLDEMQDKASDDELAAWFEQNVPDFQKLVQAEIDAMLSELAADSAEDE